jgi:hypothetical protein
MASFILQKLVQVSVSSLVADSGFFILQWGYYKCTLSAPKDSHRAVQSHRWEGGLVCSLQINLTIKQGGTLSTGRQNRFSVGRNRKQAWRIVAR